MNKVIILIMPILCLTSCMQSTNSNTFDRTYSEDIGIDRSTNAGERLYQAYTVLKENCMSCHSGYHNTWNAYKTSSQWIDDNLIVSGDAYSSTLITRMKNFGGNMPKDNPQVSEDDFDKITNWIDNL